jgi:hypothetical protein
MNTVFVNSVINEALLNCIQVESAEGNIFVSLRRNVRHICYFSCAAHPPYSTYTETFNSTRPTKSRCCVGENTHRLIDFRSIRKERKFNYTESLADVLIWQWVRAVSWEEGNKSPTLLKV